MSHLIHPQTTRRDRVPKRDFQLKVLSLESRAHPSDSHDYQTLVFTFEISNSEFFSLEEEVTQVRD